MRGASTYMESHDQYEWGYMFVNYVKMKQNKK